MVIEVIEGVQAAAGSDDFFPAIFSVFLSRQQLVVVDRQFWILS